MKYFWSRREFLWRAGGGVSGVALAHMLNSQGLLAAEVAGDACAAKPLGNNPYALKPPHFKPRAKAVISLFMSGGPSAVDLFDYKEGLVKYAGQPIDDKIHGDVVVRQGYPGPLMPSPFEFKRFGQSGKLVSEVFPNLGQHVDDIAFIHSVFGRSNDHVQAHYEMQSGQIRVGFPSAGSWISYGLGTESTSLPAFVVIADPRGGPIGGPTNWSAGYMPAAYQGTLFRASGDPIVDLKPVAGMTPETAALAAGSAVEAQRARHGEVPGRHGSVGPDLFVRARVPHAGLRTEGDRHRQRIGSRPRSCTVSTKR